MTVRRTTSVFTGLKFVVHVTRQASVAGSYAYSSSGAAVYFRVDVLTVNGVLSRQLNAL